MKRLGFVKLADFGLVLTPEGRVLAMRPAVLDDGFGGRIVGWKDGDLAAAELERWEPARPAAKSAVAPRSATPTPPPRLASARPVAVPAAPRPMAAPVAIAPERAAPVTIAAAAGVPPVVAAPVVAAPGLAAAPIVEEDDWEWTIAIARARAEEHDVSVAAATVTPPPQRRMRADTVPPPARLALAPRPAVRPATEVTRVVTPAPSGVAPPRTVIPVPTMPTMAKPGTSIFDPSRTVQAPTLPSQPRRFAKGTGPHHPNMVSRTRHTDDTVPNLTPAPPGEDTATAITLPPAAAVRARPLPSIHRVSRG